MLFTCCFSSPSTSASFLSLCFSPLSSSSVYFLLLLIISPLPLLLVQLFFILSRLFCPPPLRLFCCASPRSPRLLFIFFFFMSPRPPSFFMVLLSASCSLCRAPSLQVADLDRSDLCSSSPFNLAMPCPPLVDEELGGTFLFGALQSCWSRIQTAWTRVAAENAASSCHGAVTSQSAERTLRNKANQHRAGRLASSIFSGRKVGSEDTVLQIRVALRLAFCTCRGDDD